MKIKMLTISAGPSGVRMAGQVVEVDKDEAKVLIEGGYAVPVEELKAEDVPMEDGKPKSKRK